MPNFLRLIDKDTGVAYEGRDLIQVDERLCAGLGVPVHPEWFYRGWVDWLELYMKDNWDDVREVNKDATPEKKAVIEWLAAHYTLNGYAMIGRR